MVARRRWGGGQPVGAPIQVRRAAVVNPGQPDQLLASVGPSRFLCQFAKPVRQLAIVFAGRRVVGIIGHDARSVSAQRVNAPFKSILQREKRDGEIGGGQLGPVTSALGSSCLLAPGSRRSCEPAHTKTFFPDILSAVERARGTGPRPRTDSETVSGERCRGEGGGHSSGIPALRRPAR
jgi:hypothetical protein